MSWIFELLVELFKWEIGAMGLGYDPSFTKFLVIFSVCFAVFITPLISANFTDNFCRRRNHAFRTLQLINVATAVFIVVIFPYFFALAMAYLVIGLLFYAGVAVKKTIKPTLRFLMKLWKNPVLNSNSAT